MSRNIVLVTTDSLRADNCGFLSGLDTTPVLDGMASDGINFRQAVAPGPRTPSSMPEILTGEPLPKSDTEEMEWTERTSRIGRHLRRHSTLAERLRERGYETAAFTANPWTTRTTNFHDGFDHFKEIKHEGTRSLVSSLSGTRLQPLVWVSRWLNKDGWFSQWPTFYDEIVERVSKLESPYFVWIFLMDTHTPYVVPRADRTESSTFGMYYGITRSSRVFGEGDGQSYFRDQLPGSVESHVRKAYRDATRSVDRFVGELWDHVRSDDPILAFHSDHGEAFNEHGTYGHQRALYEENIHVPFVVYNAGIQDDVDDQVSLRDLSDIVLDVADDDVTPREWTTEKALSSTEGGWNVSVRTTRWKYVLSKGDEALYDLGEDPEERCDVAGEEGDTVAELRAATNAFAHELERYRDEGTDDANAEAPPDDDLKNRLKSLGYLE
jgi:arylsulfatase